jgi:LPXTG-motif cell wall-anchored protein
MLLRQTRLELRYLVAAFSVVLALAGLYLKFFYDVPDAEQATNDSVGTFLIILGAAGVLGSLLWKRKRNPLAVDESRK